MKPKLILCLALIAFNLSAHARAVRSWSDAELLKASDLVVVGVPIKVKDLDETNSLGWSQSESFWPRFRGVETTFKVSDVLKGMPANDRVVLHHYRIEIEWGSPANGPDLVSCTPGSTNQLVLYLVKDGTDRYAPVTGQVDPRFSVRPLPAGYYLRQIGFPTVPPIADADPAVRHPVQIHVPARLVAERQKNSIKIETAEMGVTNLTVGTNMITGTECETKVYQDDKLLNAGGVSLQGGLADGGYSENVPLDFVGSLKPGESCTVEIKLTIFETDEPAQHMWSPQSGKQYRVLCEQSFKLVVK